MKGVEGKLLLVTPFTHSFIQIQIRRRKLEENESFFRKKTPPGSHMIHEENERWVIG